jgi:hypothetical protein
MATIITAESPNHTLYRIHCEMKRECHLLLIATHSAGDMATLEKNIGAVYKNVFCHEVMVCCVDMIIVTEFLVDVKLLY